MGSESCNDCIVACDLNIEFMFGYKTMKPECGFDVSFTLLIFPAHYEKTWVMVR